MHFINMNSYTIYYTDDKEYNNNLYQLWLLIKVKEMNNNSASSDLELQYIILRNILLLNYYRNHRKNDKKFTQSTTNSRY